MSQEETKNSPALPSAENKVSIADEVDLFTRHLESLNTTLPMTMMVLQEVDKIFDQDLQDFVSRNCERSTGDKGPMVPREHFKAWKKKTLDVIKMRSARTLMPRSLLVTAVSQYDAFLGRLLRALFLSKPELLMGLEKTFTFQEINKFDSLDALKNYLVEKEVESVLRKSHADQFKYMESKFSIELLKDLEVWPKFIEITERRNLFVHADGVVSNQYLSVCRQHNCKIEGSLAEGSSLAVSQDYFEESYKCLYEIGVKLAFTLWRKILPMQIEAADTAFNRVTFDLIEREEYDLACVLLDFGCEAFKRSSNEYNKSVLTINRAQAHKWAGRTEECRKILSSCDWSARGDEFKMAHSVLLDDWEASFSFMRKIGPHHDVINKHTYIEWPLFRELRKQQGFMEQYKGVFGEEFPSKVEEQNLQLVELQDGSTLV